MVCIGITLSIEGYGTYYRNTTWKTEESLWIDSLRKAPQTARPYFALGYLLKSRQNASESQIRKAIELTEQSLFLGTKYEKKLYR